MKYTRPPFISTTWLDVGGSSWHRARRPLEVLQRRGLLNFRSEDAAWPAELMDTLHPDVLIWARMTEDAHVKCMKEYRAVLPNVFFVYEIDDALDAVPTKSVHKPHMRIDMAERVKLCAGMCDIITVSTEDLGRHMRRLMGDEAPSEASEDERLWWINREIRVVPNMMADEDFATAADVRQKMRTRTSSKIRVGWGGGISHKGDLEILAPVIEHFADRVDWVFLGMKPDTSVPVEFHEGVAPKEYMAKLASLNLDLMLAPLEKHLFNECKSNLRLLEGGVCMYPVIASPVAPYLTRKPPVFSYAQSTSDWIAAIEKFLAIPTHRQQKAGKMMYDWVQKFYNMDENAEQRVRDLLPRDAEIYQPKLRSDDAKQVSVLGMWASGDDTFVAAKNLQEALNSDNDVLWLRPVTSIVLRQMHQMKAQLDATQAASISTITNGTGDTGFPNRETYFNCSPDNADTLDGLLSKISTEEIDLRVPNGPAILLSRRTINTVGVPQLQEFVDEQGTVHEEAAIYEWAMAAYAAGFRHKVANLYTVATANCQPFDGSKLKQYAKVRYGIDMPIDDPCKKLREELELAYHKKYYRPTPVGVGNYVEWVDVFDTLTKDDLAFLSQQSLSSEFYVVGADKSIIDDPQARSTAYRSVADALKAAQATHSKKAQWLVHVRDGRLRAHALWMIDRAVKENTVAVYADHDYVGHDETTKQELRQDPDFKSLPFDHDMALCRDYVSPICALNIAHLDERHLEDATTGIYAAFLDLVQRFGKERIVHIPTILFSQYPTTYDNHRHVVRRKCAVAHKHATAMGWPMSVQVHPNVPVYGQITYRPTLKQKVSIIIPTKNKLEMLQPCIDSILAFTDYPNYEIIIIDNGSTNPKHIAYRKSLVGHPKIKLLEWDHPFNFSTLNNCASKHADGEFLLLLNDDTRCIPESQNWLTLMVGCAERNHIGTVGAKLLHPWGSVQHVGVTNQYAMCGHLHHSLSSSHIGYQGLCMISHESTANTGACLLIRKSLYEEVGGLDEAMPNNFGDIALCHDVYKKGLINVTVMDAVLQHFETVTRKKETLDTMTKEGLLLRKHWDQPDPLWNPNLSILGQQGVSGMNFNLPAWPGPEHPWRKEMIKTPRIVLLFGDYNDEIMRRLIANDDRVFQGSIGGYYAYIVHPLLQNVPPIDIRKPKDAIPILQGLGIDTIVVRSLRAAPLETLSFIQALPFAIEYIPNSDECVTPIPGVFSPTQKDIDERGTEWGQVNLVAWQAYWKQFKNVAKVDLSDVPEVLERLYNKCEEHLTK